MKTKTVTFSAEAQEGQHTPPLSDEFRPERYKNDQSCEDLGWCLVRTASTFDRDTGLVTRREMVIDLVPGSGVQLDPMEEARAMFLDLDQVVSRLLHCDELAKQVRTRKKNLTETLENLLVGREWLEGERCEAGWRPTKELYYGPKLEDRNPDQGRLWDEAGRG